MKIGDKVRFLNDVGGGIITGFQGKDIVLVKDEDGFDLPTLKSECVVIDTASDYQMNSHANREDEEEMVAKTLPQVTERSEGNALSVYLAFIPDHIKELSKTSFYAYLINDSNYYIYFTYSSRAEEGSEFLVRNHGLLSPNSKVLLETFYKQTLNELEHLNIQLISFKEGKEYAGKPVVDVDLRIDGVKFYKLHSFKDTPFFESPALLYDVIVNDVPYQGVKLDPAKIAQAIKQKKAVDLGVRPARVEDKSRSNDIIEVDLHIHELLETDAGMDNRAMIEYQLETFKKVMNENLKNKGQKIVFIHGKGSGVLRQALLEELKRNYRSCKSQDASFREYGFGATMVTIR